MDEAFAAVEVCRVADEHERADRQGPETFDLECKVVRVDVVEEVTSVSSLLEERPDQVEPVVEVADQEVVDGAASAIEIALRRGEEASAGEDAPSDMSEVLAAQGPRTREPVRVGHRRIDDVVGQDARGRAHGGELKFLLGPEVREQATLAHADRVRERGDGEGLEALERCQVDGRTQDRLACPLTVGTGATLPSCGRRLPLLC